jgi:hypothetical protein
VSTIFNDLHNPSNRPCGTTIAGLCGSGDYKSWYRAAQIVDGQLAVLDAAEDASPADKVRATSMRTEFLQFPDPDAVGVQFFPSDRTRALAAWAQGGADLILVATTTPGLPSTLFEPSADGAPGFFSGVGTGVLVGALLLGGGLWYASRRDWI